MRLPSRVRSLNMCALGEQKQSHCDAICVAPLYRADIYYAALIVFILTFLPWQPLCVIHVSGSVCLHRLAITTSVFTSRKGPSFVARALQLIETHFPI